MKLAETSLSVTPVSMAALFGADFLTVLVLCITSTIIAIIHAWDTPPWYTSWGRRKDGARETEGTFQTTE